MENLSASNIKRAEQLCQKTNQFNTTTSRYSARALLEIDKREGSNVILIGHKSNDQAYEIMGLLVVFIKEDDCIGMVDSYLLSCRILGRGIEEACISWLAAKLHNNKKIKYLAGKVFPTERNKPAQGLYEGLGFQSNNNEWLYELKNHKSLPLASHIKIVSKINGDLF